MRYSPSSGPLMARLHGPQERTGTQGGRMTKLEKEIAAVLCSEFDVVKAVDKIADSLYSVLSNRVYPQENAHELINNAFMAVYFEELKREAIANKYKTSRNAISLWNKLRRIGIETIKILGGPKMVDYCLELEEEYRSIENGKA